MGIESITNPFYRRYSEQVTPIIMIVLGLICSILCYPGVGPADFESLTVAVAGLYMVIESGDEFLNELCEFQLQKAMGENTRTPRLLQIISICCTSAISIALVVILIDVYSDPTAATELVVVLIIALFRISGTAMEIYWMQDAANYVNLVHNIQNNQLTSVIRDAYRLYLMLDPPDAKQRETALLRINAMSELPNITLKNLRYAERTALIKEILLKRVEGDEYNGTNAAIWREFNIHLPDNDMPDALKEDLNKQCPISSDSSILVKDSHVWCYIPGRLPDGEVLTSFKLGELCMNFIPGIGVIWRYPPCDEDLKGDNVRNRWVLMYKGEDGSGVVPDTLDTTWTESLAVVNRINGDRQGKTETVSSKEHGYDTMSLLDVIAATYTHFVRTGNRMFVEKFTRVKEQFESEQYGTHHVYIGRFNMSGLNNNGYLDVGGNESTFHSRGLSVCKRYFVD